jgi:hypothetical protein
MKTLEMMNEAERTGATYRECHMYYSAKNGFTDINGIRWVGHAFAFLNDLLELSNWKLSHTVTENEKVILRSLLPSNKYIARDSTGRLFIYDGEPKKDSGVWNGKHASNISVFKHLFQMVKWEDEKPKLISDLLK